MLLKSALDVQGLASLPRMRGDDPGMFERGVTVWRFAPHARG